MELSEGCSTYVLCVQFAGYYWIPADKVGDFAKDCHLVIVLIC